VLVEQAEVSDESCVPGTAGWMAGASPRTPPQWSRTGDRPAAVRDVNARHAPLLHGRYRESSYPFGSTNKCRSNTKSGHRPCSVTRREPDLHERIRSLVQVGCVGRIRLAREPPPSVSVIIPTHNRAETVCGAIASVLDQRRAPNEVIVVDDCSTDETTEALQTFGSAIQVFRTKRNIERGAARNLGAAAASGELVAFLDADDEWTTAKLEVQLADVPRGLPSVTGVQFMDGEGRPIGRPYAPPSTAHRDIWYENPYLAAPSSILLPKTLHERLGGFPEGRQVQGSEDWVFLVKLAAAGLPIVVVEQPLVRYRIHDSSSTADPENMARSMWSACEWIERAGTASGLTARRRRARAATAISCAFARQGQWRKALSWGKTAISAGTPAEGLRATFRIVRSSGAGLGLVGRWPQP
jgi:hypothetical protein